ncbi:MAG: PIN domain-containing protein [Verrucomicrobiales bacterium]|nr:PIN domain-containing protein [Verrucomicrobiales bacterium]
MYANVLSKPTRPVPNVAGLVDWLRKTEQDLAVNPIILGELDYCILHLPAGRRRTRLAQWFEAAVQRMRIQDFDAATASEWARLLARLRDKGTAMPIKDSVIAATALAHRLTMATRNTADFHQAGVPLEDSFRTSTCRPQHPTNRCWRKPPGTGETYKGQTDRPRRPPHQDGPSSRIRCHTEPPSPTGLKLGIDRNANNMGQTRWPLNNAYAKRSPIPFLGMLCIGGRICLLVSCWGLFGIRAIPLH